MGHRTVKWGQLLASPRLCVHICFGVRVCVQPLGKPRGQNKQDLKGQAGVQPGGPKPSVWKQKGKHKHEHAAVGKAKLKEDQADVSSHGCPLPGSCPQRPRATLAGDRAYSGVGRRTPWTCNSGSPLRSGCSSTGRPTSRLDFSSAYWPHRSDRGPRAQDLPTSWFSFKQWKQLQALGEHHGDRQHRNTRTDRHLCGLSRIWSNICQRLAPWTSEYSKLRLQKSLWWHVCLCCARVTVQWDSSPQLCFVRGHKKQHLLHSLEGPWRARCLKQELRQSPAKGFSWLL